MGDLITRDFFTNSDEFNIEHMHFVESRFDVSFWEALRGNSRVSTIAFHRCEGLKDSDLEPLSTLPKLRHFYCYASNLTGSCLQFLKSSRLTSLEFIRSPFSKENYRYLRNFTKLKLLSLKDSGIDETIFNELPAHNRLKWLDLSFNRFNDKNDALIKLKKLAIFHLVGSPGASNIIPYVSKMRSLEILNLGDCNLLDKDLESLSSSSLDSLDLTLNRGITDEALKIIRKLRKLRLLYLGGTSVTSKGLESLANSPAARFLFGLELRGFYPDVKLLKKKNFPRLFSLHVDYSEELEAELLASGYAPDNSGDPTRFLRTDVEENPRVYFLHTRSLESDFNQTYRKEKPEILDELNWTYDF